ncbi:hypothetical protein FOA52_013002 [Chlamydomonas sp. UWO 241]|nr:hypothetical protein FOA52_013002 [Chlamydomonas sp. UWO 241]
MHAATRLEDLFGPEGWCVKEDTKVRIGRATVTTTAITTVAANTTNDTNDTNDANDTNNANSNNTLEHAAGNAEHTLQSDHRTFDPEEADFFYVPQYSSCYFYPIFGWADWPWFAAPGQGLRVAHGANMVQQTKDWIAQHYPFWNRTGGRDHVWTFTHDEGACWAPNDVAQSIFLTHWGRGDVGKKREPHYSRGVRQRLYRLSQGEWRAQHSVTIAAHPTQCLQNDQAIRHLLNPRSFTHRREGEWRKKHNVTIGARDDDIPGSYSENLARSRFCLTLAGDGYSARAEDAILHGCIPVVIQDGVHQTLESALDWSTFSVRIPEAEVHRTLEILLALPDTKVRAMQVQLSRVWHRFRYVTGPGLATMTRGMLRDNLQEHARQRKEALEAAAAAAINAADTSTQQLQDTHLRPLVRLPRPFRGDPTVDDAFSTILQWLHSKVDTRGARAGRAPSA